jgi:tetratricopeptide (TPR) repeat protein
MKRRLFLGLLIMSPLVIASASRVGDIAMPPDLAEARRARDVADIGSLQKLIRSAASTSNDLQVALLEDWLCEAAYAQKDTKLVKQAAEAGVQAAQRAVANHPDSARAHWLLGDLLGKQLPYVFLGGLRYGHRSVRELETAMQLDPFNANAFISRAIAYYMSPRLFGGDKHKAVALMQKATKLNPAPDSPDTAHIWLALAYDALGKKTQALREINLARKLNPDRQFAQQSYDRIMTHG